MSNSKYRAFAAAAELKSLSKAGERLGYTQSGISHLVASLEEEFGFVLLNRSRSGVSLTAEGEALLPHVSRLLAAEDDIIIRVNELKGVKTGTVRIGTFSSIAIRYLPGLLSEFAAAFPGIEVSIMNGTYSDVEEALLAHKIDCGFVTLPSLPEFKAVPLLQDRHMAIIKDNHPLAGQSSISLDLIAQEPFIMPAEGSNYDTGKLFAMFGITPRVSYHMNDDHAAVAMVRKGLGFTVIPELLAEELPLTGVKAIPLVHSDRSIGLAVNSSRYLSPAIRAFTEFAVKHLHR